MLQIKKKYEYETFDLKVSNSRLASHEEGPEFDIYTKDGKRFISVDVINLENKLDLSNQPFISVSLLKEILLICEHVIVINKQILGPDGYIRDDDDFEGFELID